MFGVNEKYSAVYRYMSVEYWMSRKHECLASDLNMIFNELEFYNSYNETVPGYCNVKRKLCPPGGADVFPLWGD